MQYRKKIGDLLLEAGLITEKQLDIALEEQKKTGELLGAILYGLGFISQKNLLSVLSMSHSSTHKESSEEETAIPDNIKEIVRQSRTVLRTIESESSSINDISLVPVVRLVESIIATGINKGATDIHIGPDARGARIRYRIDGLLQHGMYLPGDILPAVVSRVKIMGSMNIAENRLPQDGAAEFKNEHLTFDLRISTFPVAGGENVVIRLLNKSQLLLGLENLGFGKDAVDSLNLSLNMPYGMFLVTGPTGSGKTTTLYSALSIINSVYKNIFTIEDPIEYHLPLIRQSQINVKAGLTFASGLRSILRQDPDVILVGEMRDIDTVELAIRASLTGHLVFSTLHTNDAASSLPRLIDMGVEPFLLASTIDTIVSQRLIRLLCSNCKESYPPADKLTEKFQINIPENTIFYRAKGCQKCSNSGYAGRTVIYEIMKMNDDLRELVISKSGSDEISNAAKNTGMKSMFETGISKVISGVTSLEEVLSATRTVF